MVPIRQEARIAARTLLRSPLFSAAAVVTIALAIGANTAVFSVTNAVMLRALPFDAPDRLVWINSVTADQPNYPFSLPEFLDYRDRTRSLDALIAFATMSALVGGDGPTERLQGIRIAANAFDILGVRPAAGRLLNARDDRADAPKVAVLGFETWQRRFGGRTDAIGTVALLNGEPFEIVGVLPRHFPFAFRPVEIVVPLAPDRDPSRAVRQSTNLLRFIGRLRPDVTPRQAEAELNGIAQRLRAEYPAAYASKVGVSVRPLHEYIVRNHARALTLLSLAMAAGLLVACGNLVNLLLARAAARTSDVAVRLALGASTLDVARALWMETLLLSTAGGLAGLVMSWWTVRAFVRFAPADVPRLDEIGVDARAIAFAAMLIVIVATILAVAPLWQVLGRRGATSGLPTRDWGSSRRAALMRHAVIVAEMALTVVLLLGSMLLIRSFQRLQDVDPGFAMENRVVARIALPRASYRTPESIARFADRFTEELKRIPGVVNVGGANVAPLSGVLATVNLAIEGRPPQDPNARPSAQFRAVTDGYLGALGVPLVKGRTFDEHDNAASVPVALINRRLADGLFGDEDPIGRSILIDDSTSGLRPRQVVGVVGDVRQMTLDGPPTFDVYIPMRQVHADVVQWLANNQFWVITMAATRGDVASGVRQALQAVDSTAGLAHVRPLDEYVDTALAQRQFATAVSSGLGAIAVALVVVGLYGVMAYSVAQRTREIGLRAAVGASRAAIWWLITRGALRMLAAGAVIGVMLAAPVLRPLEAVLFKTELFDTGLIAGIVFGLMLVGTAAATLPALRAARIDPVTALRG